MKKIILTDAKQAVKTLTVKSIANIMGVGESAVRTAMGRKGCLPYRYAKIRGAFPQYEIKDSVFGIESPKPKDSQYE